MQSLWVVMPTFNEGSNLKQVIDEWVSILKTIEAQVTLCILDDGSTDDTASLVDNLVKIHPMTFAIRKQNSGHGQTCVAGYRLAAENGADWVLQVDSDGQCDPKYFPKFWEEEKKPGDAIIGFRQKRGDGTVRLIMSRLTTLLIFGITGLWVHDSNSPYRLVAVNRLKEILKKVPSDFYLANVLVSILLISQSKNFPPVKWMEIGFRDRFNGSRIKWIYPARQAVLLVLQLIRVKRLNLFKTADSTNRN